jgi:hypothetical protein
MLASMRSTLALLLVSLAISLTGCGNGTSTSFSAGELLVSGESKAMPQLGR